MPRYILLKCESGPKEYEFEAKDMNFEPEEHEFEAKEVNFEPEEHEFRAQELNFKPKEHYFTPNFRHFALNCRRSTSNST